MRQPFQRRVVHGYPSQNFEPDISKNFPNAPLVTVTVETLDGITAGDTIIETHFRFIDDKLIKTAEESVIHQ